MALSLRALKWRNSLLHEKYAMTKAACEQRSCQVIELEEMLDRLHNAFTKVVNLQDKVVDTEQSRNFRSAEPSAKRKFILKTVTPRNFKKVGGKVTKVQSYQTLDSRERSMIGVETSRIYSFLDASLSHESQPFSMRVRTLETNCNLQHSYNTQLRQKLQETVAEALKLRELFERQENKFTEAHRAERRLWNGFLAEFKANCEGELIRQHQEFTRLHSQLSAWMARHGTSIQKLAFDELRQIIKNVKSPGAQPEGQIRISELFSSSPIRSQEFNP